MERYDWRQVEREKERKRKAFEIKKKLQVQRNIRADIKGAKGKVSLKDWEAIKIKWHMRCAKCKVKEDFPYIRLTMDHIKPLVLGGSNRKSNIQPLCRECNWKKGSKHEIYPHIHHEDKTYEIKIKIIKGFRAWWLKLKTKYLKTS